MGANEKNEEPSPHILNICAKIADYLLMCTYCLVQISDCSGEQYNQLEKLEAAKDALSVLICQCFFACPCLSLLVLTGPNWSLLVLSGPYWTLLVLADPYWALLGS